MTDNLDETTSLRPVYAARLAEDLKHNAEEQERLASEVAALQEKLATLRHDQALLVNMQQALGHTEQADEPAAAGSDEAASVPRQATPKTQAGKVHRGRAKKSTAAAKTAPAARSTQSAKQGKDGTDQGPTLRDLVVTHLSHEGEPRSAIDVADALSKAHPERGIKITVVRSTLEAMVAKGHVRRSKRGKSVFYTADAARSASTSQPVTA
ncbi:hypothetical protein AQI88_00300 [Streptomyces cellostaticus]|uniref:Regulatory protein n=1 Tax=Streptomyces cellostaticus TaxID=67285 RepID=A0A117PZ42_9ACTN|nr:hypothetical protein [Streptomyces cellostaticus]KUM99048.1 hypothetical protein AQI88_00300 [Streptomyces cellostaticus]GHI03483.1 hypothetical protein Scel_18040 [Streptomyces cellostaticus]